MKVKNIAFSGFMAAIMLSMTGAANATVEIASKAYVDALDKATTEALGTKASQTDLTALEGRVGTNESNISGLQTKVSTNESNIGTLQTKVGTAELSTTAKNIAEAINELKDKTDGMPTEGNLEEINDKITALQTTVGNETSGLVKDVTTLNSGADVTGSVANTATGIVTGYAVPKPNAGDCNAQSGLCLLSVKGDGTLQWVDVTKPAE